MASVKRLWNTCLRSPDPGYAAAGDILRVVSCLLVAWFHIWQQSWLAPAFTLNGDYVDFTPYVRTGYMMVDMMLVLSGFLAYLPYANGTARTPKQFYIRRAARLLPSYWFCLIVAAVFTVLEPDFQNPELLFKDIGAHLLFIQDLFGFSYTATRLNGVLWTLAVEVQFYLILPALAPLFAKRPIPTYLIMLGAGFSAMFLWTKNLPDTTLYVNRLPNMLVVYANGMLAAHLYARLAKVERGRPWIALLGTVAAAVSVYFVLKMLRDQAWTGGYPELRLGQLNKRFPFSLCGAVFLLGGSLSFTPIRFLFSNRLVRFLSGISFNFYIWHKWLATHLKAWRIPPYAAESNPNQVGEMPWQLNYTLLCFGLALILAVAITYLIEKPTARWILRRAGQREKAAMADN